MLRPAIAISFVLLGCAADPKPIASVDVVPTASSSTASAADAAVETSAPRESAEEIERKRLAALEAQRLAACDAGFPKRVRDAQAALADVAKERADAAARCKVLKGKCVPRPGGTAAACVGVSKEDRSFYEDGCIRWTSTTWYDGSARGCVDPVSLEIHEETYAEDVARIRDLKP